MTFCAVGQYHDLVKFGSHELWSLEIHFFSFHYVTIVPCNHCGLWPVLISHHHVSSGLVEVKIYSFVFATWPRVWKNLWRCILRLLIIKHHHVKFTDHRSRENGDITFFSCHTIWCVHEINGLCDFLDYIPPSEATSLPSFVAIGIAEVLFVCVCMWKLFNVGISVTMELLGETNLNQQKWK